MPKRNKLGNKVTGPGDAYLGKPVQVSLRKGETEDRLIKRFMKKVRNEGILQEYFARRFFEKPSIVRRRKKRLAIWNQKNNVKK